MVSPTVKSRYISQPSERGKQGGFSSCQVHFAVVLFITLVIELVLLFVTAGEIFSVWKAVLLHVLLVALLYFWQQKLFRCPGGVKRRTANLFLVATAAFGPVGVVGTLLTIVLHAWYRRTTTSFEEWYRGLFPKDEPDEISELADFLEAHGRLKGPAIPDSFRDILANGTLQQKRDAIVLMSKHFRPEFAPALRSALVDPDNSIRVMAASAITRIENRFLEAAIQVDKAVAESPDNVDLLLRQARLYDDHAFTGLLEEDREEANREKAKQIYRQVLRLQPDNYQATYALGRLLIRAGEVSEAADLLQGALRFRKEEPQLLLWYAECLYKLGRYGELRKLLQENWSIFAKGPAKRQPRVADAVRLWSGREISQSES